MLPVGYPLPVWLPNESNASACQKLLMHLALDSLSARIFAVRLFAGSCELTGCFHKDELIVGDYTYHLTVSHYAGGVS